MSLKSKVILVTGGTGALGGAVTRAILEAGAKVAVSYIVDAEYADLQSESAIPTELRRSLSGHRANLTDEAAVAALMDAVLMAHGRLDGVVCLAGGFVFAPLLETSVDQLDRMLHLNFRTLFLTCRAAFPHLKEQGGAIVTIGSRPGTRGQAGFGVYGAAKAAVINFTETLADEGRPDNIRAFCLMPSIIDTPANRKAMPDADPGQWVAPASIARVVSFLLDDASRDMSGAIIPVYGNS
jgi:NAD(P)-dependent dehydrogenase (short-subunit alcohol dehydrogenase family)